ncbi:MAG: transposase [Pirellulales bacterium]
MGRTSKSPKRILQVAFAIGQQRLPAYSHRFSPKKFTLPQLFACLVLKEFLRLDYRKLSALLEDAPSFAAVIGLKSVPHFTTFQKAADRLLVTRHARRLLDETVEADAAEMLEQTRNKEKRG